MANAGARTAARKLLRVGDFQPGDVIRRTVKRSGAVVRYTVLDPPRTSRGKLRMSGPNGGYMTTWWDLDRLPKNYRLEDPSDRSTP